MNRLTIIQLIIDTLRARNYLEIGVERGEHFFKIRAEHKVAVDPRFKIKLLLKARNLGDYWRSTFIEKTSDNFFLQDAPALYAAERIGVAFIDGLHTYEQSLRDFENCVKYLAPGGVVLIHDCNPVTREAAAPTQSQKEMFALYPDRQSDEWTGDVWKTLLHIRSTAGYEVFTLDCDRGLCVVRKKEQDPLLHFTGNDIQEMTYDNFDKNRPAFLNLKEPGYIHTFLKSCKSLTGY